jgi:hypothetical protein
MNKEKQANLRNTFERQIEGRIDFRPRTQQAKYGVLELDSEKYGRSMEWMFNKKDLKKRSISRRKIVLPFSQPNQRELYTPRTEQERPFSSVVVKSKSRQRGVRPNKSPN